MNDHPEQIKRDIDAILKSSVAKHELLELLNAVAPEKYPAPRPVPRFRWCWER